MRGCVREKCGCVGCSRCFKFNGVGVCMGRGRRDVHFELFVRGGTFAAVLLFSFVFVFDLKKSKTS